MTEKEHFIATLQACYFGDKNAFNEIVSIYDEKVEILKEVRERIMLKQLRLVNEETYNILHNDLNELLEILDKGAD